MYITVMPWVITPSRRRSKYPHSLRPRSASIAKPIFQITLIFTGQRIIYEISGLRDTIWQTSLNSISFCSNPCGSHFSLLGERIPHRLEFAHLLLDIHDLHLRIRSSRHLRFLQTDSIVKNFNAWSAPRGGDIPNEFAGGTGKRKFHGHLCCE